MSDGLKRKAFSWLVVCCGVIIAGICVFMQYQNYAFPKAALMERYAVLSKNQVKFSIESLLLKNRGYTEVSGWIYVKNEEPQKYVTSLVLYNDKNDKSLVFPLKMVERVDVAKMRKERGKYNYENSGFDGYIPAKYMTEMPHKEYQLGFLIADGQKTRLVKTGIPYKIGGLK
ncbi:hypothetical protein FAM19404_01860 [Lacticaseibacillus paracasei]|uniref:hypothetical protein n=1 Tax=Lacticaseibacillus paracasei TaxID=1597 RepID=UPI000F439E32|nr:hypothetical protein [Lacticaseibacillus paracasei]RND97249.1 hypothetical protein FAM19404_01860 [Lacticaseibacillus paracasei]